MSTTEIDVTAEAADRLRTETAAVRLRFHWLGTRRALSTDQKAEAADTFEADGRFVSAAKKLLDTRHPRFLAVSAIRTRVGAYWRSVTLPFPEPCIRLIRHDRVEPFSEQMALFQQDLATAVEKLNTVYAELKRGARRRLGRLFNEADYPISLDGLFEIEFDFPSVEPPAYLAQLNPELYQQQCRHMQARFDEAVRLAETAFVEELTALVDHLSERLAGHDDGRPKIFRDSAVENLKGFFGRFQALNIRSNDELDRLVDQCRQIVGGVVPSDLRTDGDLRRDIAGNLAAVGATLEGFLVDRPRRRILRAPK